MCPGPLLTRLRDLLGEFLRSFPDLTADSLAGEIEKALLIGLSKVFGQVKQWTDEYDSDEEEVSVKSLGGGEHSGAKASYLDNHHCLTKIIGDLMIVLSVNSEYVQHLAGNILVAISKLLLATNNSWDDFLHFLCLCLELAICNCLPSASNPCPEEAGYIDFYQSTSTSLLKLKLKSADWLVAAAILKVLHNILKNLKQDFDEISNAYLNSVPSIMLNLPWDMLAEIYVDHYTEVHKGSVTSPIQTEIAQPRKIMFFGNFIQFLCSLVALSSLPEDGVAFLPVIHRIIKVVPKLVAWCHSEIESPHTIRISHYFRHKVLMLMIKLSSRMHIEEPTLMIWINLLQKYFGDLLLQTMSGNKSEPDGSLEGSPFCTSVNDPGKHSMSCRHLQRLTVFLFLKCSLNLVGTKGNPGEQQFELENSKHQFSEDMNLNSECYSGSVGLAELHKWLQLHVPADMAMNNNLHFERCVRFFSKSFLQLFMLEDDILFEMLLQLLRVPLLVERPVAKDKLLAGATNPVYLAYDLFNPIYLFHLFLAEIHHDHQVLLDYLISKDTGSSCAEYLLRSLRIICDSWSAFVEFPGLEESSDQLRTEGQGVIVECRDLKGVTCPISSELSGNRRQPFVAARDCLLSLRTSINSLNEKHLFPYNPQVLLRRLVRFQELCAAQ